MVAAETTVERSPLMVESLEMAVELVEAETQLLVGSVRHFVEEQLTVQYFVEYLEFRLVVEEQLTVQYFFEYLEFRLVVE